jgi:hypothetical protein
VQTRCHAYAMTIATAGGHARLAPSVALRRGLRQEWTSGGLGALGACSSSMRPRCGHGVAVGLTQGVHDHEGKGEGSPERSPADQDCARYVLSP